MARLSYWWFWGCNSKLSYPEFPVLPAFSVLEITGMLAYVDRFGTCDTTSSYSDLSALDKGVSIAWGVLVDVFVRRHIINRMAAATVTISVSGTTAAINVSKI